MAIEHIGGDLGQGAIKLVSSKGASQLSSFIGMPTGERIAATDGVKRSKGSLLIEHDGKQFYVGANAHNDGRPLESVDYDRLLGSPEIKALLLGALTEHADDYDDVEMLVGLPLALLGEENKKQTERTLKKWLTGEHRWTANGVERSINIVKVGVTSQPTGALFDFLYDDEGKPIPHHYKLAKGELGMLSIGFYTVEMQVLRGGKLIQRLSGSTENGVHRLLQLANDDGLLSLGELDELLRSGSLDIDGPTETWSRIILGDTEKQWEKSRWKKFGRILTVGGGIHIMNGHLGKYEAKAHVPADPVMSIAHGLYKRQLAKA